MLTRYVFKKLIHVTAPLYSTTEECVVHENSSRAISEDNIYICVCVQVCVYVHILVLTILKSRCWINELI